MANVNLDIERARSVFGNLRSINSEYTGPASYVTGGDSLRPEDIALGDIENVWLGPALDAAGANPRLLVWNPATDKVRWFVPNTGAEVANATDLSGFKARFFAIGK